MRHPRLLAAVLSAAIAGAAGLVASPLASATAASGASAPPPATVQVIVRPVTSAGGAAAGYQVQSEPDGSVDCTTKDPSPGAVSSNIELCSPSAEYAVACWKAAVPHRVLCIRNPATHTVARIPRSGAFRNTAPAPASEQAPLLLVLVDGDTCSIRAGGAAGSLVGHPHLFITYYCATAGAVWAGASATHLGVNESSASWTVQTAQPGHHALVVRHVKRAFFVGTRH